MRLVEVSFVLKEIVPVLLAAIIPVCFGTMLGWPCVTYPLLVNPSISPILISLDQTSLIAGFLFEGNTLGCFFSSTTFIPSKIAICLCLGLQVVGWILMYFSQSMFWFLGSRFSIGFAHGYGQGQIKRFIKETCRPHMGKVMNLYLPVCLSLGVLITFTVGAFVDFRNLSVYMALVPCTALLLFVVMPTNKINCVDISKSDEAEVNEQFNVFKVIMDKGSWKGLFYIFIFVFVQQYGGGPSNIVYTQMIFDATGFRYPKIAAIIYAIVFVVSTIISLRYSKRVEPKANLIVGSIFCILAFTLMSLYYYFKDELLNSSELFVILPFVFLIIYNFFHTFSYGCIPFYILRKIIPPHSVDIAGKFYLIHFSLSAVISTKIFQVIFDRHSWYLAYAFFVAVLIFGLIFGLVIKDFQVKENILPKVVATIWKTGGIDNPAFNGSEEQIVTKF